MPTLRRIGIFILVVVLAGLAFAVIPASALRQPGFTVRAGAESSRSYPPIAAAYPVNDARNVMVCDSAPYCDVVPIRVEIPTNLAPDEDYVAQVLLVWDSQKVSGQSANNMDLSIYSKESVLIGRSACCEPEKVQLFNPVGLDYLLLVANVSGVNLGYTLKGSIFTTRAEMPDEFLGLDPVGGEPGGGSAGDFEAGASTPGDSFGTNFQPEMSLAPVDTDSELSSIGESDFDQMLRGAPPLIGLRRESSGPPKPVGAPQVILWAGAFPAALVLGGWLILRQRNPSLLESE